VLKLDREVCHDKETTICTDMNVIRSNVKVTVAWSMLLDYTFCRLTKTNLAGNSKINESNQMGISTYNCMHLTIFKDRYS